MTCNCRNCGKEATVAGLRLWKEYRVGSADSPDRFLLCPGCDEDDSVDPAMVWARDADATMLRSAGGEVGA